MGQYYVFVNETKKEYVDPAELDGSAKLWEVCYNPGCAGALTFLTLQCLSDSNYKYAGRWAGDKLSVVGDYDSSDLYTIVQRDPSWRDITQPVKEELRCFLDLLKVIKASES